MAARSLSPIDTLRHLSGLLYALASVTGHLLTAEEAALAREALQQTIQQICEEMQRQVRAMTEQEGKEG